MPKYSKEDNSVFLHGNAIAPTLSAFDRKFKQSKIFFNILRNFETQKHKRNRYQYIKMHATHRAGDVRASCSHDARHVRGFPIAIIITRAMNPAGLSISRVPA